jgi:hypothetical protein
MLHTDCSTVALSGRYDAGKHNPAVYVNPLLFALFVPKFNSLDERMLLSNIAGVVKAKYQRESIATLPDYRLFYALVTDKNDVVCDSESPIKDLRNRVLLQQHLWNSVIALRAGKYFDVTAAEFVNSIDNCKFSIYSPEVANMGDETVILKRLFAAFSFNPITVVSAPVYSNMNYTQYNTIGYTQEVYNVPYLQINVPPAQALAGTVNVTDALNQVIYEFQNNTFVQRQRRVHSVDEVIAVSLSRKFRAPEVKNSASPFFVALPLTINGYETINQAEVNCPPALKVGDDNATFVLKSAVFAELMTPVVNTSAQQFVSNNEIVVGTSAIVKCAGNFYAYRPVLIHTPLVSGNPTTAASSPVTQLLPGATDANGNPDIDRNPSEIINKRGLVVFYQKA